MSQKWLISALALLLIAGAATGQGNKSKKAKKPNPVLGTIKADPSLPNVLLIGDSISIGYTLPTRKLLKGKANVHRIPTNGGPTIRGLEMIEKWLGKSQWDVIHFNWGLHDLKMDKSGKHQVPLEQYKANLQKLVKTMKPRAKMLIWASTTPVPKAKVNPPRSDEDVVAYNKAAQEIMKENGVATDDLYSFILPKLEKLQRAANVHFTPAGSEALASEVARHIQAALKEQGR